MEAEKSIRLRLELVWWLLTAIVAVAVLLPIVYRLPVFRFLWPNVAFVLTFITVTRYIFLLKYTFLAKQMYVKVAVIFASIIAVFLLVQEINLFQTYLDENSAEAIVGTLPRDEQTGMMAYIRTEYLLFGVGSAIACVLLPLRMVLSVWRQYNGYPD